MDGQIGGLATDARTSRRSRALAFVTLALATAGAFSLHGWRRDVRENVLRSAVGFFLVDVAAVAEMGFALEAGSSHALDGKIAGGGEQGSGSSS